MSNSRANLETMSNDIEKENPLTAEALGSNLLSKEDIELKTEIPFADDVWNTALLKSMADMIEIDFLELRDYIVIESPKSELGDNSDYRIFVKVKVPQKEGTEIEVKMPLAKYLAEIYKRQIGYSEEYAVSHNRQGRKEVTEMVGDKYKQQTRKQPDMLGDMTKR